MLALVVIALMTTALGLLASSMQLGMWEVRREMGTVSLVALTDAAIAETLAELSADESFAGLREYAFGGGLISSEVVRLGQGRVEIRSRAAFGERHREQRVEVRLTGGGPVVLGLRRPIDR